MFGGFDGEFFNDLNVMDIGKIPTPKEHEIEFSKLVNSPKNHDIIFRLHGESENSQMVYQDVYGIRSLLLYRSVHKEVPIL